MHFVNVERASLTRLRLHRLPVCDADYAARLTLTDIFNQK